MKQEAYLNQLPAAACLMWVNRPKGDPFNVESRLCYWTGIWEVGGGGTQYDDYVMLYYVSSSF